MFNKTLEFEIPNNYEGMERNGKKYGRVPAITWYTNLDTQKRHTDLILYKTYTPEEYPKYDNYPAINVDKTADIPYDYDGLMGVPITFLDKYNPEQYEIIDAINRYSLFDVFGTNEQVRKNHSHTCNINGEAKYFRIIIRRKK